MRNIRTGGDHDAARRRQDDRGHVRRPRRDLGLSRIHNPGQPLRLAYTLSSRQLWRSHFGMWGIYWRSLLAIHAVVASVVALAWWSSWWFLLILAVPIFPPIDNFWRWAVGVVGPLFGGRRIEAVIDVDGERVGANFRGHGLEYMAYQDIRRIDRFGDLWCLLFDRNDLEIPAALIDATIIQRMKERLVPD